MVPSASLTILTEGLTPTFKVCSLMRMGEGERG